MLLGHSEDALEHFWNFLRLDPHSHLEFAGYYNIGRTYLGIGDWQAADTAFARSLTLNSMSSATHCQLAIAKNKLGQDSAASTALAKARDLEPATSVDDWVRRLTLWYPSSTNIDQILEGLRRLWDDAETDL